MQAPEVEAESVVKGPAFLRAGDLVQVRSAEEILKDLDADGSLDGLPFMPEMLEYCGTTQRVFQRVEQAVIDTAFLENYRESFVRDFKGGDVVLLGDVRCSGAAHDGCSRGCMIFWKAAWLRKVEPRASSPKTDGGSTAGSGAKLCTKLETGRYFCQSSEILKATNHLTHGRRLGKWALGIRVGNYTLARMIKQTAVWAYWRIRRRVFGEWPRGTATLTPTDSLGLRAGDLVEVKPLAEIMKSLDRNGKNRGLHFSADMALLCGKRLRVRCRADKWISEGTGKLCQLRNTVILEGAICDSSYYAFGGCPRSDFQYWREIWLRRAE